MLVLLAINPITQVRAASDFVGVSDTLPQLSYYTYTVEIKNGSTVNKYSVSMSIRNITSLSSKAIIYVLFETNLPNAPDPVMVREFDIEYKVPDPIDTNSLLYPLGLAIGAALIMNFLSGWIINKATPQKQLTYTNNDLKMDFVWDNNGVLKSMLYQPDANNSYQIKRVIEPLYIYGAVILIGVIFIVVIVVCAKRK